MLDHIVVILCLCGCCQQVCRDKGHTVEAFEIKTNPNHNILTKAGFKILLRMALTLCRRGAAMFGPPCSLFVYLSTDVHKRSADAAQGDTNNAKVVFSNIVAMSALVIMIILSCRSVFVTVEQPSSSKLWDLWCWKKFEVHFKLARVFTHMKCFGHAMPKPTVLKSSLSAIGSMRRVYSQVREHAFAKHGPIVWTEAWSGKGMPKPLQARSAGGDEADFYHVSKNGKWVVGGKDLASSAADTVQFALGIVDSWEKALSRSAKTYGDDIVFALDACGLFDRAQCNLYQYSRASSVLRLLSEQSVASTAPSDFAEENRGLKRKVPEVEVRDDEADAAAAVGAAEADGEKAKNSKHQQRQRQQRQWQKQQQQQRRRRWTTWWTAALSRRRSMHRMMREPRPIRTCDRSAVDR